MKIIVNITEKQIADALVSAFEGGSNYWIKEIEEKGNQTARPWGKNEPTPSYISAPLSNGGSVVITARDGDEGGTLNLKTIKRGLTVMAKEFPRHFGDLLSEDSWDAETADVLLQCCIYGKVIYG